MKITTNKIIRELTKKDWNEAWIKKDHTIPLLIKDTLDIIDTILRQEKNISIKGKK